MRPSKTRRRAPTSSLLRSCSNRRATANAGAGTGWISRAMQTARATATTTTRPGPGPIATLSSAPSTTTCPSISSCAGSWPAMNWRPAIPTRSPRPASAPSARSSATRAPSATSWKIATTNSTTSSPRSVRPRWRSRSAAPAATITSSTPFHSVNTTRWPAHSCRVRAGKSSCSHRTNAASSTAGTHGSPPWTNR